MHYLFLRIKPTGADVHAYECLPGEIDFCQSYVIINNIVALHILCCSHCFAALVTMLIPIHSSDSQMGIMIYREKTSLKL